MIICNNYYYLDFSFINIYWSTSKWQWCNSKCHSSYFSCSLCWCMIKKPLGDSSITFSRLMQIPSTARHFIFSLHQFELLSSSYTTSWNLNVFSQPFLIYFSPQWFYLCYPQIIYSSINTYAYTKWFIFLSLPFHCLPNRNHQSLLPPLKLRKDGISLTDFSTKIQILSRFFDFVWIIF